MAASDSKAVAWVAVDWGSSHLRIWGMSAEHRPIVETQLALGMTRLTPDRFEPTLKEAIEPWLPQASDSITDVMICGMAGARGGWQEAPYREVPCAPLDVTELEPIKTQATNIRVFILPGLSQQTPADVMRGEEAQLSGVLAENPQFSGAICLPGTHSKWVSIENGKVKQFATCMTGETFEWLSSKSVLANVMNHKGWNDEAFSQGALSVIDKQAEQAASPFNIRAKVVLGQLSPNDAYSYLSGQLIAQELLAHQHFWREQSSLVLLVGGGSLTRLYEQLLKMLGCEVKVLSGDTCVLRGLTSAYQQRVLAEQKGASYA
ncbi:MAG: 2-dehydro-3-deoxygalactonokinase [Pontibacterium sp.]